MHIAQVVIKSVNVNKLTYVGCKVNIRIAKQTVAISLLSSMTTSIRSDFDTKFENQTSTRRYKLLACDETKWKSPLIAKYGVALTLTVDQKGCGAFNSIQKAVDAVPSNSPKPTLIIVDSGTYREKVKVEIAKSNLIIQGQGYTNTFIVWGDTAANVGTVDSYSVGVFAPKFIAHNISFKNTAPPPVPHKEGQQAVAFRISGDQAAFYSCGFYGYQDTLLDESGRHYFKNCFIEGSIDFIFGNGRSLYEDCTLNSVAQGPGPGINGAIAAQKRETLQEKTGFSFVNCKIVGQGNIWLGRAWGNYSTTVFIKTAMSAIINHEGWNDMNDKTRDQKVFFGQYACWGPGSHWNSTYAKNLSLEEATPFMSIVYIDGQDWLHP